MEQNQQATASERRLIYSENLRSLCITRNWYTRGTCEEYEKLFAMLDDAGKPDQKNLSTQDIVNIARNIKDHSATDYEIADICFELAEISHTFFTISE